jgi:DNA-directed RNA polymerase subunit M/transcription elongation factor TFIIS
MAYSELMKKMVTSKWVSTQMYADWNDGMTVEQISERFDNNGYGFNHPSFTELKRKMEEQDEYISNPPDVVEGVVECKCGSKKVYSVSVQTRASDEPMSTQAFCTSCKARWIQNC